MKLPSSMTQLSSEEIELVSGGSTAGLVGGVLLGMAVGAAIVCSGGTALVAIAVGTTVGAGLGIAGDRT